MTPENENVLAEALGLHRRGELVEAAALCHAIVESEPDSADVWHLLGALALQQGDNGAAIAHFSRALELDGTVVDYHVNLGNALHAAGRYRDAIHVYERALALREDVPETHFNLANALTVDAKTEDAKAHYNRALDLRPQYADAHNNLALLHKDQGDVAQAIVHFRKAVGADADFAPAWVNLCGVLRQQGKLEEARDVGKVAVSVALANAEAHYNLAQVCFANGDYERAAECFRQATELDSGYADAYCNLGPTLLALGDVKGAIAAAEQALAQQPDMADAHWNRGFALLLAGRVEEGWEEYEWRFAVPSLGLKERTYEAPLWDGQPLVGQTLFVHAEQGFGDTIQFTRYLPMLRELAGSVVLECYPALERLMTRSGVADRNCTPEMQLPEFDAHIPMMSLARLLGTTLTTVPNACPYLAPAHSRRSAGELSAGVVWAGNLRLEKGLNRSCRLSDFAPVFSVPGMSFASLQVDLSDDERHLLASLGVADLGTDFRDFADTAETISKLDLVITIDTAVAHLSGALATPVWTVLPFAPDWRWLLERKDSPWYPTMRLFRQPRAGDWASVVNKIVKALGAFAQSGEVSGP